MNPFYDNKKKIKNLNEEISALHTEWDSVGASFRKKIEKKRRLINKLQKQCAHTHMNGKTAMFHIKDGMALHAKYYSASWDECKLCGYQCNTKYHHPK